MTEQSTQPSKPHNPFTRAFVAVAIVLAVAVGLFYWFNRGSNTLTLNRYYPDNTRLFVEFEPGDKLTTAFLTFHKDQDPRAVLRQALPQPSNQKPLTNAEQQAEHSAFGKRLTATFTTLFEPHFSFGIWSAQANTPIKSSASQASDTLHTPQFLSAFPLKDASTTLDGVMTALSLPAANYDHKSYLGQTYTIAKAGNSGDNNPTALAIIDHDLLMASSEAALQKAIEVALKKHPKLFDEHSIKAGLSGLSNNRNGVVIINAGDLAEKTLKAQTPNQAEQILDVAPRLFASLHVNNNQVLSNLYIPMNLNSVQNKALRKAFTEWLNQSPVQFSASEFVPQNTQALFSAGRLDGLLTLMVDHAASTREKQNLKSAEFMLGLVQLDLRKDVFGLLADEVALAIPQTGSGNEAQTTSTAPNALPVFLLAQNEAKKATWEKLIKVASTGMLPLTHEARQIGSVTVDAFKAKGGNPKAPGGVSLNEELGIASLSNKMVAVGTMADITPIVAVSDAKQPALNDHPLFKTVARDLPAAGLARWFVDQQHPGKFVSAMAGVLSHDGVKALTGKMVFQVNDTALAVATP